MDSRSSSDSEEGDPVDPIDPLDNRASYDDIDRDGYPSMVDYSMDPEARDPLDSDSDKEIGMKSMYHVLRPYHVPGRHKKVNYTLVSGGNLNDAMNNQQVTDASTNPNEKPSVSTSSFDMVSMTTTDQDTSVQDESVVVNQQSEEPDPLINEEENVKTDVARSSFQDINTMSVEVPKRPIAEKIKPPALPKPKYISSMVLPSTNQTRVNRASSDPPPVTTPETSVEEDNTLGQTKQVEQTNGNVESDDNLHAETKLECGSEYSIDGAMDIKKTESEHHTDASIREEDTMEEVPPDSILVTDTMMADISIKLGSQDKSGDLSMSDFSMVEKTPSLNEVGGKTVEVGDTTTEVRDTTAEVGDTTAEVGDTTTEVGDTTTEVGDTTTEVGDTTTEVGDTTADTAEDESVETIEDSYDDEDEYHSADEGDEDKERNTKTNEGRGEGEEEKEHVRKSIENDNEDFQTSLLELIDVPEKENDTVKESIPEISYGTDIVKGSESASSSLSRHSSQSSSGTSFIVIGPGSYKGPYTSMSSRVPSGDLPETESYLTQNKEMDDIEEHRKHYATNTIEGDSHVSVEDLGSKSDENDSPTESLTNSSVNRISDDYTMVKAETDTGTMEVETSSNMQDIEVDPNMDAVSLPTEEDNRQGPPPVPPKSLLVLESITPSKGTDDIPPALPPKDSPSLPTRTPSMLSMNLAHSNMGVHNQGAGAFNQTGQGNQPNPPNNPMYYPNLTPEQQYSIMMMYYYMSQQQQFTPPQPSAPLGPQSVDALSSITPQPYGLNSNPYYANNPGMFCPSQQQDQNETPKSSKGRTVQNAEHLRPRVVSDVRAPSPAKRASNLLDNTDSGSPTPVNRNRNGSLLTRNRSVEKKDEIKKEDSKPENTDTGKRESKIEHRRRSDRDVGQHKSSVSNERKRFSSGEKPSRIEPNSKPKAEPTLQSRQEWKPSPKPQPRPENKQQPRPEHKQQSRPEPKPQTRPQPKPRPEQKQQSNPEPKPQTRPQPKPRPEHKQQSRPEPKPQNRPQPKPMSKSEMKDKMKPPPEKIPEEKVGPRKCYFYICQMNVNTMKENLVNYLEACVGEVSVLTDHMIHDPQNSQALVVFSDTPDMEKIHKKLSEKPIEGSYLKGEKIDPPTRVAVSCEGTLKQPKSLDLYFESDRIGGAPVKGSIVESEDGSCFMLEFEDNAVVERICGREEHTFDDQVLRVSPYYTFEGGAIWDHEIHVIPKAEPIELTLPPEQMRFLKRCCMTDLMSEIGEHYGTLESHTSLKVICTLTPKVADFKNRIRAWPGEMKDWINKYVDSKVTDKDVLLGKEEQQVWDQLVATIEFVDEDNLNVFQDNSKRLIKLTGYLARVQRKYDDTMQRIEEIRKVLRRTTMSKTFKNSRLSVLEQSGELGTIMAKYSDAVIHVVPDMSEDNVTVEGQDEDIQAVFVEIYDHIGHLNEEDVQHQYSRDCVRFVVNHKGIMSKLNQAVEDEDMTTMWTLKESKFKVCCQRDLQPSDVVAVICKHIDETSVDLDRTMEAVLDTDDWTNFSAELTESFDDVCHDQVQQKMVVYGYAENVLVVKKKIKEFMEANKIRKEVIKVDPLKVEFLTKHKEKVVSDIQHTNVVTVKLMAKDGVIHVSGKIAGVTQALKSLDKLRKEIVSDSHEIKDVGIEGVYVSEKEKGTIDTIEKDTCCLIRSSLDNVPESYTEGDQDGDYDTINHGAVGGAHLYKDSDEETDEEESEPDNKTYKCKNGITIQQVQGEIGREALYWPKARRAYAMADILVASCSPNLDLKLGGASKSLLQNAGSELQNELKSNHKEIKNGEIVMLKGYQLECSTVILTSLPNWTTDQEITTLLHKFMTGCLNALAKKKKRSIMFSAMGTGQLKYPHARVAEIMYQAVIDFDGRTTRSTVEEVKFIMYPTDNRTIKAFEAEHQLLKEGGGQRPTLKATLKNIEIEMVVEDLAYQKVDAILCSSSNDFNLSKSGAAAALLKAGGSGLQDSANALKQAGLSAGQVGKISPGKLQCKAVFLTVLPAYSSDNKTVISDAVKSFLNSCNMEKFASVAMPAMGTGFLKYPESFVSQTMVDAVCEWDAKNPSGTLKSVRFIMYAKDYKVKEAFMVQVKKYQGTSGRRGRTFLQQRSFSRTDQQKSENAMFNSGCYIGPVTLTVKSGNIVNEKSDAIVSSLGQPCEFLGAVAQELIQKCPNMKNKCIKDKSKLSKNGILLTDSEGGLNARHVIHVHYQERLDQWQKHIYKCLEKANAKKLKSLAFPVLGTGQGNQMQQPEDIAGCMFDAILEFLNKAAKNVCLKDVRIVVFHKQPQMTADIMRGLTERMDSKKDSKGFLKRVKGVLSNVKDKIMGDGVKPKDGQKVKDSSSSVKLTIYAESQDNIEKCKTALKEKLAKNYLKKALDTYKETVKSLTKEELAHVENTTLLINIKTDVPNGVITIDGPTKHVSNGDTEIQNKLREIERRKRRVEEAKMLYSIIKWHYTDITNTSVSLKPYDESTNLKIETAYKDNKKMVKLEDSSGAVFVIDFATMMEYPEKDANDTIQVVRKDIIKGGDIHLPKEWMTMGDENMKMVNLAASDPEYVTVANKFMNGVKTGNFKDRIPNYQNIAVTKIERIQNKTLYQQYMAKKKQIEGEKPSLPANMPLERTLWHGTAQDAVTSIQKHGFNRSYAGKNGIWFGAGVYFAADASYSARPWLAQGQQNPPNNPGQNKGYLFMCKVLTGHYTQGNPQMRFLPAVDPSKNPTLMFDSAVDKLANPVEFVIFHDTQAYPEYIITFNV